MPTDGLFFRVLRRFNILWFAILGVVVIAVTAYQVYSNPIFREYLVAVVKPVKATVLPAAKPGISVMPETYGSYDTEYAPWGGKVFVAVRNYPLPEPITPEAMQGYKPAETVNVLVIDAKGGDSVWLFPTNKQVIVSRDSLFEGAAKGFSKPQTDPRPVIGMVMLVAPDGTAKTEPSAVYVWTKESGKTVKLFVADKVLSFDQSGADRYLILYEKGTETHVATYALPEFKLISDKRVPDLPK